MKPAKEHKSKRKKEKKSKRRNRSHKLSDHLRLISLAQLGDAEEVEEFLQGHAEQAINMYDADGFTPLHQVRSPRMMSIFFSCGRLPPACMLESDTLLSLLQACRGGHLKVVECLLRCVPVCSVE